MKNANLVSRPMLVLLAAVGWLGACSRQAGTSETAAISASGAPKTAADYFPIAIGDNVVRLQLAVLPTEMQRGLMERTALGSNDGMIFVYERPQTMSFWMRNTPTALDIGFFTPDGVLEEIYPLHPFDERTVESRSDRLQFAVELNQGWFRANGVQPGARLDVKALATALTARGFAPRRFGLK